MSEDAAVAVDMEGRNMNLCQGKEKELRKKARGCERREGERKGEESSGGREWKGREGKGREGIQIAFKIEFDSELE